MPKVKYHSSCDACLGSKVKCSQTKPSCIRCVNQGFECVYGQYKAIGRPPNKSFHTGPLQLGTKSRKEPATRYNDTRGQRLHRLSPYPSTQYTFRQTELDISQAGNRHTSSIIDSSPYSYSFLQQNPLDDEALASCITNTASPTDIGIVAPAIDYTSDIDLTIDTSNGDGLYDLFLQDTIQESLDNPAPHDAANYLNPLLNLTPLLQEVGPDKRMERIHSISLGINETSSSSSSHPYPRSPKIDDPSRFIIGYNYSQDGISMTDRSTPGFPGCSDYSGRKIESFPLIDETYTRCTMRCHDGTNEHLAYLTEIQATKYNISLDTFFNIDASISTMRNQMLRCPTCSGKPRFSQTLLLTTMVQSQLLGIFEREYAPMATTIINTFANPESLFSVPYTCAQLTVGKIQIEGLVKSKFSEQLLRMYIRRQLSLFARLQAILDDLKDDDISSKITSDLLVDVSNRAGYLLGILELRNGIRSNSVCRITAPYAS